MKNIFAYIHIFSQPQKPEVEEEKTEKIEEVGTQRNPPHNTITIMLCFRSYPLKFLLLSLFLFFASTFGSSHHSLAIPALGILYFAVFFSGIFLVGVLWQTDLTGFVCIFFFFFLSFRRWLSRSWGERKWWGGSMVGDKEVPCRRSSAELVSDFGCEEDAQKRST